MDSETNKVSKVETTKSSRKRLYGYICGILSGVTYGTNPLFGLPLLNDYQMPVDSVLFYRYASAALCMGIWCATTHKFRRVQARQTWLLIVLGLLFSFSSFFLFRAYHYIPSGIATTIIYVEPVLVALIMVALKQYPTWQKWLAIAVSFGGVVLLCQPDTSASYAWQGILLAFLAALSYAFYMVIVNISRRINLVSGTFLGFITLVIGSVMFFCVSQPAGIAAIPDLKALGLVMGLGLVPTIGALVTMTYATRTVGATTTAVLGVMEPITAMAIGVLIFDEGLTIYVVLGFLLTAGAIVFMTLSDRQKIVTDSEPRH